MLPVVQQELQVKPRGKKLVVPTQKPLLAHAQHFAENGMI